MRISTSIRYLFFLLVLLIFSTFGGYSETIQSKGTGNWGDASTWQPAKIPTASDVVIISNGHTVSVNIVSAYCSSLVLETGSKPTVLSILGTNTLNVSGNIDIYDGDPSNVLAVNAGTLNVGGNITLYGNGNKSGKLTVTTGKVDVGGNLGFVPIGVGNQDNQVIDVTGSGAIVIGGQFLNSGSGTITPASIDNIFIRQSYFKSANSGDWNTPSSWLISKDNSTYYSSPIVPNGSALGIQVVYPHVITLSTNSPATKLVVDGSLICNSYIVNGPGPFTLNDNATISTSNSSGLTLTGLNGTIQVDGIRTYSSNANYTFTGSLDQCTGSGFPAIVNGTLTINKNAQSLKVSVCNPLIVTKLVDVIKGELYSGGNLTLQATATSHANIGNLSSEANVTGDVNIQVFMAGGYRSARLLSSPINLPNQVFRQLQKYILITGPGGVTNGFDKGGLGQPYAVTLNLFNESLSSGQANFVPVSNIQNSMASGVGFHAFFRGKRGATDSENYPKLNKPYSIPEDVTVTYTGPINKFDLNKIMLTKSGNSSNSFDGYNLLGNPYPCTIDYHQIPLGTNIKDELMIIKPNGAQATYIMGASISNNGGTRYIQPGQGFFLTAKESAEIIFKESFKSTSNDSYRFMGTSMERLMSSNLNLEKEVKSQIKVLKINLQDNLNSDETTIAFKEDEFEKAGYEDAPYISGSTVSLFSLKNNKAIAVNFMPPKSEIKEIKLFVNSNTTGSLKLNFTDLSGASGYKVLLKDLLFPDTLFDVNQIPSYLFDVNKADPKTYGSDRFSIIFKLNPPSLFVAQKVDSMVQLTWTSHVTKLIQFFEVEVSTDNVNFQPLGQVSTAGNVSFDAKYSFIDKRPSTGRNFYRLKQVTKDGSISFTNSEIVDFNIQISEAVKNLLIFPNPSSENIYFSIDRIQNDQIEACIYDIQGKRVETNVLPDSINLRLNVGKLPKGIYFLELKKNKNKEFIGHAKFVVGS